MEAPDKIYAEIRHPISTEYTEIIGFETPGENTVKYIRADLAEQKIKQPPTQEELDTELAKCKTEVERKAVKFAMQGFITQDQEYSLYHGFYMGYDRALEDVKKEANRQIHLLDMSRRSGLITDQDIRIEALRDFIRFIDELSEMKNK